MVAGGAATVVVPARDGEDRFNHEPETVRERDDGGERAAPGGKMGALRWWGLRGARRCKKLPPFGRGGPAREIAGSGRRRQVGR